MHCSSTELPLFICSWCLLAYSLLDQFLMQSKWYNDPNVPFANIYSRCLSLVRSNLIITSGADKPATTRSDNKMPTLRIQATNFVLFLANWTKSSPFFEVEYLCLLSYCHKSNTFIWYSMFYFKYNILMLSGQDFFWVLW